MNIGIITWFGGRNYGTSLQAIALSGYLEKRRYSSTLIKIDIKTNAIKKRKRTVCQFVYSVIGVLTKWGIRSIKGHVFDKLQRRIDATIESVCDVSDSVKSPEEYVRVCANFDVIICGSDQIWNPTWYHPIWYADYDAIKSKLISYAPSVGKENLSIAEIQNMERSLSKFSHLSMRERSSCKRFEKVLNQEIACVADPVLLWTKAEWDKFSGNEYHNHKYILCYFLSDNACHWKCAKRLAKRYNLPVYIIPMEGHSFLQKGKIQWGVDLERFLDLIKNARIILTDSYHATLFSVIFEKNFWSFERHKNSMSNSQNLRMHDFLRMMNLEDRILEYGTSEIEIDAEILYEQVNMSKDLLVSNSEKYLMNAIES